MTVSVMPCAALNAVPRTSPHEPQGVLLGFTPGGTAGEGAPSDGGLPVHHDPPGDAPAESRGGGVDGGSPRAARFCASSHRNASSPNPGYFSSRRARVVPAAARSPSELDCSARLCTPTYFLRSSSGYAGITGNLSRRSAPGKSNRAPREHSPSGARAGRLEVLAGGVSLSTRSNPTPTARIFPCSGRAEPHPFGATLWACLHSVTPAFVPPRRCPRTP